MGVVPKILRAFFSSRLRAIERMRAHPAEVQGEQLRRLLEAGAGTVFGREHDFGSIRNFEQFQSQVPLRDYDGLFPYIERMRTGEKNVLWRGETRWFAKSSGTTGAKSKYIPVTRDGLKQSHLQGPRDCIAFNVDRFPETGVYGGKTLTLGGSRRIEREGESALTGDLSAILIENTPWFANLLRVPDKETSLLPDFEQKVERICRSCAREDVRSLAGVPSWNLVMLRRLLEFTGKQNLLEIWPRLELFIHGGVNFSPYREIYHKLIPNPAMHYLETYNASEGFFGIADDFGEDMLLMLDYGMFYEFLPLAELEKNGGITGAAPGTVSGGISGEISRANSSDFSAISGAAPGGISGDFSAATTKTIPLEGVKTGVNYAMIITSSNGLWRYLIGDTVRFTSVSPYRIVISGRTKHYINAFGEEIIVDNAERAIRAACEASGAEVADYTAAPIYMKLNKIGAHQWVIEFSREPSDIDVFAAALDRALKDLNSDYEAKRHQNTTLLPPVITPVPAGTFMRWMAEKGKTGGQNKVPRLANDRTYIDDILALTRPDEEKQKPKNEPTCI